MVGWTALLQDDTKMQVRCVPAALGMENYKNLKDGRYLWYLDAAPMVAGLLEGAGGYASKELGPFQLRTIWPSYESVTGYMVRGDSDIKTPADIKPGTKICYFAASQLGMLNAEALVAWSGVDPDDIVFVPYTGFWDFLTLVADGRADITWSYPTAPMVVEQEAAPHGIAWIELDAQADPEGAKRFLDVWNTIQFGVNQIGTPSSVGNKGLLSITMHLARADTDADLVYNICKWLWENYDKYQDISPTLKYHHLDTVMTMVETSFVPAHDGLIRYLKEIGKWTPAHQARQDANVELMTRYENAFQNAMKMAAEQKIEVDTTNDAWVELWENFKKSLALPKFKLFIGLD
jgi:TRAP transporter TAXI family solute receptor